MRIESGWCAANGFRSLCAHFSLSRHFGGCQGTSRPKNSSGLRREDTHIGSDLSQYANRGILLDAGYGFA
jgi:hypothetical protein